MFSAALRDENLDRSRWLRWCVQVPALVQAMEAARKCQAAAFIDKAHEIADGVDEDPNAIAKAKLQCDQARWTAARIDPANWGSKREVAIVGDESRPVSIAVIPATLPPHRWAEQVATYEGGTLPVQEALTSEAADAAAAGAAKPFGLHHAAHGPLDWTPEELADAGQTEATEEA